MAKRKGGLGRGLNALFGDSITAFEPVSVISPEEKDAQAPNVRENGGPAGKADTGFYNEEAPGPDERKPGRPPAERPEGAAAGSSAERSSSAAGAGDAKGSVKGRAKSYYGKAAGTESKPDAKKTPENSIVYIKLTDIKPNAMQPRTVFDEEALGELAESIKEHGVIQPVLVRPSGAGYELVAGERRWRAAHRAGLKSIPAIVRDLDDRQNLFFALIENIQREDLNAIEEARGIREIMDSYGLTQEEAAKSIGRSRPYVANALRLLKLPENVQRLVENKQLSAGHARAIAGLSGAALQSGAAEKAAKEGWSVRQIENYTGISAGKKGRRRSSKDKDVAAMEDKLAGHLGTKVRIKGSGSRGRLELDYYSREELDRLIDVLLGE